MESVARGRPWLRNNLIEGQFTQYTFWEAQNFSIKQKDFSFVSHFLHLNHTGTLSPIKSHASVCDYYSSDKVSSLLEELRRTTNNWKKNTQWGQWWGWVYAPGITTVKLRAGRGLLRAPGNSPNSVLVDDIKTQRSSDFPRSCGQRVAEPVRIPVQWTPGWGHFSLDHHLRRLCLVSK